MVLTTVKIEKKLFLPQNCAGKCHLLKHVSYNRSKRTIDYPSLRKMNEASMFETTQSFVKIKKNNRVKRSIGTEMILLPVTENFSYDLASDLQEAVFS